MDEVSYSMIVLYSRDQKGVGVTHKITSPKNQPQFSQTMMRQYWFGPNKLSDQPEMPLKVATEFKKIYLFNGIFYITAKATGLIFSLFNVVVA